MNKPHNILKGVLIGVVVILGIVLFVLKPNNPFQVLALIGALSWISIMSDLLIRFFIKPKIIIIPDKDISLGYTLNGPIINTQLAILSENKVSLVNKIEIEIIHANNDTNLFTWKWFEETLHEVMLPDRNIPTRKNQKAIAIRINENEMVEKIIGFHQNSFKNDYQIKTKEADQRITNIGNQPNPDYNTFKASNEYNALIQLFNNSFLWRVGTYSIKYKVYILNRNEPFTHEIRFSLTDLDVSTLKQNIPLVVKTADIAYKLIDEDYPEYNWINKQIENAT